MKKKILNKQNISVTKKNKKVRFQNLYLTINIQKQDLTNNKYNISTWVSYLSVSRPMLPYKLKGITMGYKYNCSRKKKMVFYGIFSFYNFYFTIKLDFRGDLLEM